MSKQLENMEFCDENEYIWILTLFDIKVDRRAYQGTGGTKMHSEAGALLLAHEIISEQELKNSLTNAIQKDILLVQSIVQLAYLGEEDLAAFLSSKLKIPKADEKQFDNLPAFLTRLVPKHLIDKHFIVPIMLKKGTLHIAMADPTHRSALEAVSFSTGFAVSAVIAKLSVIEKAIATYYEKTETALHPSMENSPATDDSLAALFRKEIEHIAEMSFQQAVKGSKEDLSTNIEDAILAQARSKKEINPQSIGSNGSEESAPLYDFEAAKNLISQACDRKQVAQIFIRYSLAFVKRAVFLIVKKDQIKGWYAAGEGVDPDYINDLEISLDLPSVFKTVKETSSEYYGSLPKSEINEKFVKYLGGIRPKRVLLIPMHVRNKMVCMYYADSARSAGFSKDLGQLHIMVAHVCKAFEEILIKNKLTAGCE